MKRLTVILIAIIIGSTAFKAGDLPQLFTDRLSRAQMTFTAPDGYAPASITPNSQMHYEYALKYPDKKFEIRYSIAPLDSVFIQFEAMKKSGTNMVVNPNNLHSGSFMATAMNLSGGNLPQIREFPKQAVANEFNADWGATCVFHVVGAFGDGYSTCMAVAIHKDNFGDAYIFYLSDSMDNYENLLQPVFHALKFK